MVANDPAHVSGSTMAALGTPAVAAIAQRELPNLCPPLATDAPQATTAAVPASAPQPPSSENPADFLTKWTTKAKLLASIEYLTNQNAWNQRSV